MRRFAAFLGSLLVFVVSAALVFAACLVLLPSVLAPDQQEPPALGELIGLLSSGEDAAQSLPEPIVPDASSVPLPESAFVHGLWYEQLEQGQQGIYDQLLAALSARQEVFVVSEAVESDVAAAFAAVIGDHPELFWLTGGYTYRANPAGKLVEVTPKLTVAVDEIDGLKARIEEVAAGICGQIPADASDYEKARVCYEWIIDNTDYAEASDSQNIRSVFLGGVSVCAGYARAFQYLMHELGMRCDYLSGGGHAWNLVWIADTPTYVDVTWGDPVFIAENGEQAPESKTYDYLCLTADELYRTHTLESPTTDLSALPACDATTYDYYRLNGLYLETFVPDELSRLVAGAEAQGQTSLRVKYATDDAFQEAYAYVQGDAVFAIDALANAGTFYLGGEEHLRILSLDW